VAILFYICKMKKNLHIIIIAFLFSVILWVSISLSNDYYATFEIPLKLVNFPTGYATGTPLPEKVSIKVKGKGWKLIAVNLTSESDYIVPVGKETGRRTINLFNYYAENQWLSSDVEVINISPDTLSFFVEKIASKKVKIIPNLNLNFRNGYGLASKIIVTPDSTIISGPASYVRNMKSVPTESTEFNDLSDKIVEQISLKDIPGMTYKNKYISVSLDVQKIVDKNFNNLLVKIVDVPRDRNVILLPNRISIAVRGGIDILGRMDTTQFNAFVNYRDVVLDTLGSVVPHIKMPENTSLLFIKPERLRYIIKKYN